MGPLLVVLFLGVPLAELWVIVSVSSYLGVLDTIGLLVVVSVVGAWLVKREGIGVWQRAQQQMAAGRVPGREMLDGLVILFAGALLLTPGFLTDVAGVLLLLPPVRALIRRRLQHRFADRVAVYRVGGAPVIDVDPDRGWYDERGI